MPRRIVTLISLLFVTSTLALTQGLPGPLSPRVPKGLYTNFILSGLVNQAEAAAYPPPAVAPQYPNPNGTPGLVDEVLIKYFLTLLSNPAVSGLAPQMEWADLSPNNPGPDPHFPAPGAYAWNPMDDVFIAVTLWNLTHIGAPPKTIQLIVSSGFNSPLWVWSDIDASVCGPKGTPGCGSCDPLFMTPATAPPVSHQCGYTTLFWRSESEPQEQIPLPMPWNAVYKNDWKNFLIALNRHVQLEPSSEAVVSIAMSGPTASSTEMILPSDNDQGPFEDANGDLTLGNLTGGEQPEKVGVPAAWNALFQNFYGSNSNYQNTDLPFIEEWKAVIDEYSQIFSGITLALTTTTDALPTFTVPAGSPLLNPAPGFESDCGSSNPVTDPNDAMACSAVTQVLVHFTNPLVGGSNAKSIWEAGMTAARDSVDLGTNAVKWLSATTAAGTAPLPGTSLHMSRMIGGMQFSHSFSDDKPDARLNDNTDVQAEGCPTYPKPLCLGPPPLTPSEGFDNVMQLSYFPGTAAGPSWGASSNVTYANWVYTNAPMNFLEIYNGDIIYAMGLSQCQLADITGSPSTGTPPNVSTCIVTPSNPIYSDVQATQQELNLASQSQLSITEP